MSTLRERGEGVGERVSLTQYNLCNGYRMFKGDFHYFRF